MSVYLTTCRFGVLCFLLINELCSRSEASTAFLVATTGNSTVDSDSEPIPFDDVVFNFNNCYNATSDQFKAPSAGTYWFHLSVGVPPGYKTYFDYQGDSAGAPVVQRSYATNDGVDQSSRAFMEWLPGGALLHGRSGRTYSSSTRQTSWFGFLLDDVMSSLVAFSVGRSSDFNSSGRLLFTDVFVNNGSGWNATANEFVVPVDGIYFFSYSLGILGGEHMYVQVPLYVNSVAPFEFYRSWTFHGGVDTNHRAGLLRLSAGDRVYLMAFDNWLMHSRRPGFHTSFGGFLYQPAHGFPVAWSVHTRFSGEYTGLPVPFEIELVNEGEGWNRMENEFRAPVGGVYYVQFNAGAQDSRPIVFSLMVNDQPYSDIMRTSTFHFGPGTMGQATMVALNAGDIMYLVLSPDTQYYSDFDRQTSFSGFLLYPNV